MGYTHLAAAEEIENKLHLLFTVGPRDERAAGPECKKKAKVQQQKQKLTCDISADAAMRADGAPSPPRDGDTTGGGGEGGVFPCNYIAVLRNGCMCA